MAIRTVSLLLLSRLIIAGMLAVIALIFYCNHLVIESSRGSLYSSIHNVPYNRVGVLLGTSKYSRLGGNNDHYRLRVESAFRLFQAGKIDYILISGDNGTPYYDEPSTIRRDLLKKGIPAEKIYRDYAGFRTLDSIIRANQVFALDRFTVISQATHNKRALYIAHQNDINAIGFNAGEGKNTDFTNWARELLARVLAVFEVHMFNTEPRFLGPAIEIGKTPPT